SVGSGEALAFQETPAPPPADVRQAGPDASALQLGTPSALPADPQAYSGGLKLFGYTVLPNLNFGLDVLYGEDQQKLQLGGTDSLDTLDQNGNATVLGKVKRRF
ncbi:MAG TPA: hypothetical protein VGN85_06880, partial [Methyloceanibacter sp.]|nr:hypothetical protein [Methyloceanibacter sp.]